ncbi:hypothetical protein N9064_00490 [bacterium]|nr:hypothetical protein [bacterium]
MKTKLIKLSDLVEQNKAEPKKKLKGIEFTKVVGEENIYTPRIKPNEFQNIIHIGTDESYGDVFKAWNRDENCFCIYFGNLNDGVIDEWFNT